MHSRVKAQHGNVIAADFRPTLDLKVSTTVLYMDEAVALLRFSFALDGKPIGTHHVTVEAPH